MNIENRTGFTVQSESEKLPEYDGHTYFWAHEYRHYLRDCTEEQRKAVHDALIRAGLSLDGKSPRHLDIISSLIKEL